MNKRILIMMGLVWSISVFSQTTNLTDSYQPPQTVMNVEVRMLDGFHADSKNVIYNNGGEFVAKSKNLDPNNPNPEPEITNPPTVYTPSIEENYIYVRSYLEPVVESNNYAPQIQSITYFDGLGRPKQNIAVKSTPGGNDLVTPIIYDGFGRQTRDYLPISVSTLNSDIQPTTENDIDPYYSGLGLGTGAFSEKILENSPLDRVLEQYGAGNDWKTKSKRNIFDYQANGNGEVIKFTTSTAWSNNASTSNIYISTEYYYPQGSLYKNKVTDEDNNVSYEFKNGQGQTILVRKMLTSSESADTYYVYNEYDQLAFVLPPKAVLTLFDDYGAGSDDQVPDAILNELCYQYRYDGRKRLAEKKIPGKGLDPHTGIWNWESMVYDNQDRLVMTQDANLKKEGQWLFTKYDQFGRVAYTGITADSSSRSDLQTTLDGKGSNNVARTTSNFVQPGLLVYYDNDSSKNYPNIITKLLSVNYYDTYPTDKPNLSTLGFTQTFITDNAQSSNTSTKSLPTASYLNNIEMNSWTKTFNYYDDKGRVTATYSKNYLGGYTQTESILDFTGTPQKTITRHKRKTSDIEIKITERFIYDYQNRLKQHYHQIDNKSEVLLADNTYDELGRLINKKVGNNLQEINYAYNIRGWMTGINDFSNIGNDLFAYKINYNTLDIGNNKPLADQSIEIKKKYNGNISQVDWLIADPSVSSNQTKSYGYTYDGLNRLKAGLYYIKFGNQYIFTEEHNELPNYDLNGNISGLKRYSYNVGSVPNLIDDLTYQYAGNRLTSINDLSGDGNGYEGGGNTIDYDDNGNMTTMLDKRINIITYNHLNLPDAMDLGSGKLKSSNSIIYRADGVKLKKVYTSRRIGITGGITTVVSTTDYLDGFQYLDVNPPGTSLTSGGISEEESELDLAMEREAFQQEVAVDPIVDPGGSTVENAVLQFVPTAEGYYSFTENRYIYQYKDHLGNTRVSYAKNNTTGAIELTDKNDYYPFGMNHLDPNNSAYFGQGSYKNYKYNGKELQETGMYDYGFRQYMPDVGRWMQLDPLVEDTEDPYAYVLNNPVSLFDPDGRAPDDIRIRGANGSSVTVKTNLIDVSINASSLGVDFGGNYSISGNDVLSASLDIVGIFDPTGIADGLNAGLQANNGDWLSAGISALGVVPLVGDVAKVGKIEKDVKIIDKAIDAVKATNGNSKASEKAQHVYEIVNKTTNKVEKVGISGGKVSKAGDSYRATKQVNKLNKAGGNYTSRIVENIPAGKGARAKALEVEKAVSKKNAPLNPQIHKRPKVN